MGVLFTRSAQKRGDKMTMISLETIECFSMPHARRFIRRPAGAFYRA
jgi:hypothetical protein